ncbi:MAG: shikimate dehydrogenase [Erysipelotrichaceae bacterium]|nr:shikimate dehydrogenase [Erysipelotrichaceae bacterium]
MEYGLIGKKLGHSFSKTIHHKLNNYKYDLVELNEEEFISFMNKKDFKGINVTIPYKEKVLPYLSFIANEAKEIGSVNTIVCKDNKLYGYNSDYLGFIDMLSYFNIDVFNKTVLILGTGGTSKTINYAMKKLKAKKIYFASRSSKENAILYEDLSSISNEVEIIINTTPCGMYPNNDESLIDLTIFKKVNAVVDVIFNPLKTKLLQQASKLNITYCNGLYMLVSQAYYASMFFLSTTYKKDIVAKIYNELLKEKENIVLIGMPSAGKTTIGKILAKQLNKDFIDTDECITNIIKEDISSFFKTNGEQKFREIEKHVVKECSLKLSCIIATGGGVILDEQNILNLKQNGKIIFLDRSLNLLQSTNSRPLSNDKEKLKKLYDTRYHLYEKYCDIKINGDLPIPQIVEEIIGG